MKTWSEARHAGRSARAGAMAERAAPDGRNEALPQAKERWKAGVCIYCRGRTGRRVGLLAITGKVYFCKDHREQYQKDKAWEAKHKKGLI